MRAAAALEAGERLFDLRVGRLLGLIEERGRGHDPAVDAVAALRHLLLHVGPLDRMRLLGRAEAGKGDDLPLPTADTGVTQERTAWPSTCTVQAPHCARPQPKCGLLSESSLRNA